MQTGDMTSSGKNSIGTGSLFLSYGYLTRTTTLTFKSLLQIADICDKSYVFQWCPSSSLICGKVFGTQST